MGAALPQSLIRGKSDDDIELVKVRTRRALKDAGRIAIAHRADEIDFVARIVGEESLFNASWVKPAHWAAIEPERARCKH